MSIIWVYAIVKDEHFSSWDQLPPVDGNSFLSRSKELLSIIVHQFLTNSAVIRHMFSQFLPIVIAHYCNKDPGSLNIYAENNSFHPQHGVMRGQSEDRSRIVAAA